MKKQYAQHTLKCATRNSRRAGFTLVELMVALIATAILLLSVSFLLVIPFRTMKGNREYARMRREMAYAMRLINRDVRMTAWGDIDDDEVEYNVTDGRVYLDYDPDNVVVRDENVEYVLEDGALLRNVGDSTDVLISEGVTMFSATTTNQNGAQGIVFELELQNSETEATIEKTMYIHVRN